MTSNRFQTLLLALLIVCVGFNLRPIMASVSPIIPVLQQQIGINNQITGLLTTLPVLMMGGCALLGAKIQAKIGEFEGMLLALVAIFAACALRFWINSGSGLLLTAVLGGVGIAVIQTLLPAYLKRRTPTHASTYMGLFTSGIMGGAAVAALVSSPIEQHFGWSVALSSMALPALITLGLFVVVMPRSQVRTPHALALPIRSRAALLLMVFFGIGTGAYTLVLAWLPLHYTHMGLSANTSGALLAALTLAEVVAGLSVSVLIKRFPDRRLPLFFTLALIAVGLLLLILLPAQLPWMAVSILGLGIGALFPLSLIVTLDYAHDAKEAAALLALVQGGGYIIAACFPFVAGALIDAQLDLSYAWGLMLVGVLVMLGMVSRFSPNGLVVQYQR